MAKKKEQTLNTYILLDASGSMSSRWDEALSSINAYVKELQKTKVESFVTLAAFDALNDIRFNVLRDRVSVKKWTPLTSEDARPEGNTPLYDAIGRMIALADKADETKSVIVIMTDGNENNSRELNKADATVKLDKCRDKKWQIVFLGADFNAFGQSASVGVAAGSTLNMRAGNYAPAMQNLAQASVMYASSCAAAPTEMLFSDKDRNIASGKL